MKEFVKD